MGIPAPIGVAAAGLPNLGDQANAVLMGIITAVGPTAPFAFRGPMNLAIWCSVTTTLTPTPGSLTAAIASSTGIAAGSSINSTAVPRGAIVASVGAGPSVVMLLPPLTYPVTDFSTSSANVTLPPGSNVAALVGAAVSVPSNAEGVTIPAGTTVLAVVQADVAPSGQNPGNPGIITLSAAPTVVPNVTKPQPLQFAPTSNAITASAADPNASFTDAALKWDATVQLERSFDGGLTWNCCNIGGNGQLAQYLDLSSVQLTFGEPEKNVLYRLNCIEWTSGVIGYRISQTGGAAESLAIGPLSGG